MEGGTYGAAVTDALGCIEDLGFTIAEPDSLLGDLTVNNETTQGFEDGSASVVVSGGTAPYTYSWSNGSDSTSADSLAPGTHTVTILDANGCAYFESFTVTEGPVSIEDELNAGIQELAVFPNPNQGTFTIDISMNEFTDLRLRLMDMNGRVVMAKNAGRVQEWKETVSVGNYAAGIYQLIIDTPQGSASRRIIMN
ncbi:MAG: T9SS type A sorting domain-containing protein [Bacteroidia bacterium]